ncbi:MAG TPA: polysaccharide deacetylase family protein [Patescibacteria group bacterium]|nr:polysaccharide deacetylase family protein [Patescibacteria group bacterium]
MRHKVRRALHVAFAAGLYYSGALTLLALLRWSLRGRRPIYVLGLHRILDAEETRRSNSLPGMILSESLFVALIEFLGRRVQFISLETLLKSDPADRKQTKPWCLVTFDDAWSDTYRRATPVLERLKIPAVVFVPTAAVGSPTGFWVEQLVGAWRSAPAPQRMLAAEGRSIHARSGGEDFEETIEILKHMSTEKRDAVLTGMLAQTGDAAKESVDAMMTWEQVIEIAGRGIEIGSHTDTHPLLTFENDQTLARELRRSRELLEDRLRAPVRAFAYPNGDWDRRVRESVIRAGYSCAFTTEAGCFENGRDRFGIPRFLLHDGNVTGLRGRFSRAMASLTLAGWC